MDQPPPTGRSSSEQRSRLDWFLNIFADVRAGEGARVVLLAVALFIVLCAYYVLKTVRQGLILAGGTYVPGIGEVKGSELQIGTGGVMALLMLVIVPAYGLLASRVPRKKLLDVSYAAIIGSLAIFFVLGTADVAVGLPFFIWLGIINMFVIAQFWSFANDLYTEEAGKRLFAIIAIGGTGGAILGPLIAKVAGTFPLMAISAAMFGVVMVLLGIVDRISKHAPRPDRDEPERAQPDKPVDAPLDAKVGGFRLVLRDRYLLLIALMLIVLNVVNSTGEYILSDAAIEYAAGKVPDGSLANAQAVEDARELVINDFYGNFNFWMNLAGLLIQSLLVGRIMKHLGVGIALCILPLISLTGYTAIGLVGGVALLRVVKVGENSVNYSLQNTVRQALFLPTSREVKYKAKAAIDTFFVRFGDTAAALVVLAGIHWLGFGRSKLALTAAAVATIWLALAIAIGRVYARRATAAAEQSP